MGTRTAGSCTQTEPWQRSAVSDSRRVRCRLTASRCPRLSSGPGPDLRGLQGGDARALVRRGGQSPRRRSLRTNVAHRANDHHPHDRLCDHHSTDFRTLLAPPIAMLTDVGGAARRPRSVGRRSTWRSGEAFRLGQPAVGMLPAGASTRRRGDDWGSRPGGARFEAPRETVPHPGRSAPQARPGRYGNASRAPPAGHCSDHYWWLVTRKATRHPPRSTRTYRCRQAASPTPGQEPSRSSPVESVAAPSHAEC
jgi:hypothetical protein